MQVNAHGGVRVAPTCPGPARARRRLSTVTRIRVIPLKTASRPRIPSPLPQRFPGPDLPRRCSPRLAGARPDEPNARPDEPSARPDEPSARPDEPSALPGHSKGVVVDLAEGRAGAPFPVVYAARALAFARDERAVVVQGVALQGLRVPSGERAWGATGPNENVWDLAKRVSARRARSITGSFSASTSRSRRFMAGMMPRRSGGCPGSSAARDEAATPARPAPRGAPCERGGLDPSTLIPKSPPPPPRKSIQASLDGAGAAPGSPVWRPSS